MSQSSSPQIYEQLSRQELIDLLQAYARLCLVVDGLWFLGVEKHHGHQEALAIDEEMWSQYGPLEVKRLQQALNLGEVNSLEQVARLFLLTPIWGALGAKAQLDGDRLWLTVTDCLPQKARLRKGLGEFSCKAVGLAYFEGFFRQLNPNLRFNCLVCPPDDHPPDLWCQWEVRWESPDA